jgi:hypothetical protein
MADTCPHGFPPAECLICQTLRAANEQRRSAPTSTQYATPPYTAGQIPSGDQPVRPDAVYQPGGAPRPERSFGSRFGLVLVILALLVVGAWLVAGAFFAIVRVLELLIVAAAAGWVGYRIGVYRGRRSRP